MFIGRTRGFAGRKAPQLVYAEVLRKVTAGEKESAQQAVRLQLLETKVKLPHIVS